MIRKPSGVECVALGVILLLCLPLSIIQMLRLWNVSHYQFFPFILAAFVFLLWSRWPRTETKQDEATAKSSPQEIRPTFFDVFGSQIALWFGVLVLGFSYSIPSPWLGYVATLFCICGVLWTLTGPYIRQVIPAWGLLWLMVRPPLEWDIWLIQWLQIKTAGISSFALDLIGIEHFRQGVSIEVPGRILFVEEACSGVQSLFSILALAVLIAVWNQRTFFFTIALIVVAVVGAAMMNVLRVVLITWGEVTQKQDFLSEPTHTYLGLGIFIISFLWMLSWDRLLLFWLGPIPVDLAALASQKNRLTLFWNEWIGGNRFTTQEITSKLADEQVENPPKKILRPLSSLGTFLASIGVVILCGWGWSSSTGFASSESNPSALSVGGKSLLAHAEKLNEESLPEEIAGWKRVSFETIRRSETAQFGEISQQWIYQSPFGLVSVSVDATFYGWHDLRDCYSNIGWVITQSETSKAMPTVLSNVLVKPGRKAGFLLFELIDKSTTPVPPTKIKTKTNTLSSRMNFPWKEMVQEPQEYFQIQLLVTSENPIEQEEQNELKKWYSKTRNIISKALREKK